jgi:hypothetical protein
LGAGFGSSGNSCQRRKYLFDMVFGIGQEVKATACFSDCASELVNNDPKKINKRLAFREDHQLLNFVQGFFAPFQRVGVIGSFGSLAE